jgi:hypothetical protein
LRLDQHLCCCASIGRAGCRRLSQGGRPRPRTVLRPRGKKRRLQVPPDRHPEPGFRWARSARHWVHLTRDDHARLAILPSPGSMSIGSRKYKARHALQTRGHCRGMNRGPAHAIAKTCAASMQKIFVLTAEKRSEL